MSTLPPSSPYACLTEFVHASVSASLRSCSVSSDNGRTPAIAVSASLPSVMYSGLAGIVRRTERPSSLIPLNVPRARPLLTRRCRTARRRRSRARILLGLGPFAETERQVEPPPPALDREPHDLARAQVRDNPRNVLGAGHGRLADGDDHVAAAREVEPERRGE